MNLPEIESNAYGNYILTWDDVKIMLNATHFREERNGYLSAELEIYSLQNGKQDYIFGSRFNLLSINSFRDWANLLKQKANHIEWDSLLIQAAQYCKTAYRQGEPLIELQSNDPDIKPTSYLIHPLLPEKLTTIIFGDGGSCKSTLAILLAILLLSNWTDNPFGLRLKTRDYAVLYCDYESEKSNSGWTLRKLETGLDRPLCKKLYYKRCSSPFGDILSEVNQIVTDKNIDLLILDSIAPAVGTELNAADGAAKLIGRDIRQLGVTALCIGHQSKDKDSNQKTIYGSVFYKNLARSVWEVKAKQEPDLSRTNIDLIHQKANLSGLFKPMSFEFAYIEDEAIIVNRKTESETNINNEAPDRCSQIEDALRHGQKTVGELSEELDTSESTVRSTLNKYKKIFVRVENRKWALLSNREGEALPLVSE